VIDLKTAIYLIAALADFWPKCFSVFQGRRRPLKINIHLDIAAAAAGAILPNEIAAALRLYVANAFYLRACREGAVRIDLNGEPAGVVTAAEAANSAARLKVQAAKRKAAKKQAQQAKEASPSQPKRLSLADLRQAAQARRQAVPALNMETAR
jgi:ProP effector